MKVRNSDLLMLFLSVFCIWPSYVYFRLSENIGLNPLRVILVIILMFLILHFLGVHRLSKRRFVDNRILFFIIIFYLFFRYLSAFFSGSYSVSLVLYEHLSNINILVFTYLVLSGLNNIGKVIKILLFFATVLSVLAIFEHVTKFNIFTILADSSTNAGYTALTDKTRNGFYRSQAIFEHPLSLSQFLAILFPLTFLFFKKNSIKSFIILSTIIFMGIYVTGSRSAILAIFISAIAFFFLSVKRDNEARERVKVKLFMFFVTLVLLPILFTIVSNVAGLDSEDSEGASSRTRVYQMLNGYIAANQSPIFGYGPGNADDTIFEVGLSYPNAVKLYVPTVDNLFLSSLVESGYIALFLLIALIVTPLIHLVKVQRTNTSKAISCSIISGLVTMTTLSIFTVLPIFYVILGLGLFYINSKKEI
jgi:O-antigen ligase